MSSQQATLTTIRPSAPTGDGTDMGDLEYIESKVLASNYFQESGYPAFGIHRKSRELGFRLDGISEFHGPAIVYSKNPYRRLCFYFQAE